MLEFPRKQAIKSQVLLFINDEDRTSQDALKLIDLTIDKVAADVANYCNIKINQLPEELDPTILGLTNQYIDSHNLMPSMQQSNDQVQSLTEGDVSYTFNSKGKVYQDLQAANTITDEFIHTLKKFRKVIF